MIVSYFTTSYVHKICCAMHKKLSGQRITTDSSIKDVVYVIKGSSGCLKYHLDCAVLFWIFIRTVSVCHLYGLQFVFKWLATIKRFFFSYNIFFRVWDYIFVASVTPRSEWQNYLLDWIFCVSRCSFYFEMAAHKVKLVEWLRRGQEGMLVNVTFFCCFRKEQLENETATLSLLVGWAIVNWNCPQLRLYQWFNRVML